MNIRKIDIRSLKVGHKLVAQSEFTGNIGAFEIVRIDKAVGFASGKSYRRVWVRQSGRDLSYTFYTVDPYRSFGTRRYTKVEIDD